MLYSAGAGHPMKPHRLALTHTLVLNYGLYKKMEVRYLFCLSLYNSLYIYMQYGICIEKVFQNIVVIVANIKLLLLLLLLSLLYF